MAIYAGIFAFLGAGLGVGTILFGIALSGAKYIPRSYTILAHIAFWPNRIVWPANQQQSFSEASPLMYWIGLPMLGWALIGIGLSGIHSLIAMCRHGRSPRQGKIE
jgi:hypothetical protein